MNRRISLLGLLALALLLGALLLPGAGAGAQSPEQGYTLSWWTVDGGGATFSTGGGYALGGTAGQPDPGVLSDGSYTLGGGFWGGGVPTSGLRYGIFLPVVLRGAVYGP